MRLFATLPALALAMGQVACSEERPAAPSGAPSSASVAAPTPSASGRVTAEPVVPDEPDPQALDELLNAAPRRQPPPTGPDGGTLVATETGVPEPDEAAKHPGAPAPTAPPRPKLEAGRMEIQPWLSNPAIERAAREQFYWPLVQKCRGPDGELLPPETITLVFTIRTDGSVDPASVGATATEKKYDRAAECVVREFSALPFRGPPASIGNTTRVISTLPSVD